MNRRRILQMVLCAFVIFSSLPGAQAAAKHFDAYELLWLIPFMPSFIATFFWIVIVMVQFFIQADSYKNPAAIRGAKRFLAFFDVLFFSVLALFEVAAIGTYLVFSASPA